MLNVTHICALCITILLGLGILSCTKRNTIRANRNSFLHWIHWVFLQVFITFRNNNIVKRFYRCFFFSFFPINPSILLLSTGAYQVFADKSLASAFLFTCLFKSFSLASFYRKSLHDACFYVVYQFLFYEIHPFCIVYRCIIYFFLKNPSLLRLFTVVYNFFPENCPLLRLFTGVNLFFSWIITQFCVFLQVSLFWLLKNLSILLLTTTGVLHFFAEKSLASASFVFFQLFLNFYIENTSMLRDFTVVYQLFVLRNPSIRHRLLVYNTIFFWKIPPFCVFLQLSIIFLLKNGPNLSLFTGFHHFFLE